MTTLTTSEAFRKKIDAFFGPGIVQQLKDKFDRVGVYRLLNELNTQYIRIDGPTSTVFLSNTQHAPQNREYEVTAAIGHLLVIMVENIVIVYRRGSVSEHEYLADRSCLAL